mgnify:FL=1
MISTCQPVYKLFFIFFHAAYPAALDLLRIECEQLYAFFSGGSESFQVRHGCLTCLSHPVRTIVRVQGRTQRVPIKFTSDPWRQLHLLDLKADNCSCSAAGYACTASRSRCFTCLQPGSRTLTPNNCEHSPLEARLEPDPIPITCT